MGLTEFGPNINGGDGSYDLRRLVNNVRSKYPEYVFAHMWHSWPGKVVSRIFRKLLFGHRSQNGLVFGFQYF